MLKEREINYEHIDKKLTKCVLNNFINLLSSGFSMFVCQDVERLHSKCLAELSKHSDKFQNWSSKETKLRVTISEVK